MYCGFRKYGLNNFEFIILRDDFNNIKEMQQYEKDMILYYNTHTPYGYNQTYATSGGMNCITAIEKTKKRCAKVDIHNQIIEIYESYHDAARKNSIDENNANSIRDVCKGIISSIHGIYFRDIDENNNIIKLPFKNPHGKQAIVGISVIGDEEIYFSSVSEAAEKMNIPRSSLSKCINGHSRYSIVHQRI